MSAEQLARSIEDILEHPGLSDEERLAWIVEHLDKIRRRGVKLD